MEMIYDKMNSVFSPRDVAKCLCLIEKYKFEKGFSVQDIFKNTFSRLQEEQKECYNPQNLYETIWTIAGYWLIKSLIYLKFIISF